MRKQTLLRFQKTLEERLETLQGHISTLSDSILASNTQSGDQADLISASSQGVLNSSLLIQCQNEIQDILRSLEKIRGGSYGVCEMCEDDIDEERLKIKPHAKYCIICREIYEKTSKEPS